MAKGPRQFAIDTSVPVDRTRQEITDLLREWQCSSIMWAENFEPPAGVLEFTWLNEDVIYRIRFTMKLPTTDERGRKLTQERAAQLARSSYRLLLLKLKADLNATRAGLAKAEEIFMPWMVDLTGKTIAEVFLPQIRENFRALPPGPKGGG